MHETPLATSSPIRSKIKQMGRRKAKNSRRSVSLLDVSTIDANPDVSSQISESNETLASGYRDSGYVRSEASSLEEDDSKACKDLVEEMKFKDVLICELQESNRGLRMRCADAENKIWRLRVKCQSHCGCCQVNETAQSPADSVGEDKDEISPATGKYDFLSRDLFQFKRASSSSHGFNLSLGHDRLDNPGDRMANPSRGNTSLPSKKLLTRSKSSGTIGNQTPPQRSSQQTEDHSAEKLFSLKVQQWQKEHSLKNSPSDRRTTSSAADAISKPSHPKRSAPHRTSNLDRAESRTEIFTDEASHMSAISERDSSLEVDWKRVAYPDMNFESSSQNSDESLSKLTPQSTPFADITNQRVVSAHDAKSPFQRDEGFQQHSIASQFMPDLGFGVDGFPKLQRDARLTESAQANSKLFEPSPVPGRCEHSQNCEQFSACGRDCVQPCGHRCGQQTPVIIVPTGCCSCCRVVNNPATTADSRQPHCEASTDSPENKSRLKFDVSTDSSDLHPIFEMKDKTSAARRLNFPTSEFGSKTEPHSKCWDPSSGSYSCNCSPKCSALTVPVASRFDAKAEYKRQIEEGMKKIASTARAETESLSFQPWTSPDSPQMTPLMKRLAETSHYVYQMALQLNKITSRFESVTGTPKPVNPSP